MIYSGISGTFILLHNSRIWFSFVQKKVMEKLINYVNSIFPCGKPYLFVNGYSFEWNGTHWNLIGISEPTSLDISELDLENEV